MTPLATQPPTRLADIPAVILAGGLGTRLRSALPDVPKVLAPIHHRPFLTYLLDRLAEAQMRRVILLTGYRADDVQATLGECYGPLRLEYSRETVPLGTGGAVRQAMRRLRAPTMLLLNGDTHCDFDLRAFFRAHRRRLADLSIVVARVEDSSRFGQVRLDAMDRIVGFAEKTAAAGPGWINAGAYLVQRHLLAELPPRASISLEREWLPRWIGGRCVVGFRHDGPFLDIGTPESYAAAEEFFKPAAPARA